MSAVAEQAGGIWNNDARHIGRLPAVLMLHGLRDTRVPVAKYARPLERALHRDATSVQTRWFPAEGHIFSGDGQRRPAEAAARFFAGRL